MHTSSFLDENITEILDCERFPQTRDFKLVFGQNWKNCPQSPWKTWLSFTISYRK